jgi:hypothetical protein
MHPLSERRDLHARAPFDGSSTIVRSLGWRTTQGDITVIMAHCLNT